MQTNLQINKKQIVAIITKEILMYTLLNMLIDLL